MSSTYMCVTVGGMSATACTCFPSCLREALFTAVGVRLAAHSAPGDRQSPLSILQQEHWNYRHVLLWLALHGFWDSKLRTSRLCGQQTFYPRCHLSSPTFLCVYIHPYMKLSLWWQNNKNIFGSFYWEQNLPVKG